MTPRPVVVAWLREGTWRSTLRAAAVTPEADIVLLHVVDTASSPQSPAGSYWRLQQQIPLTSRYLSLSQCPRQPVGQ
ncbi:MAG: hypothetical protein M3Y48_03805 [Actinomycetota bacterium]|nr:hypothetical protein [Actinomycetota bacterium]